MPYQHKYITLSAEEQKRIERELQRLVRLRKWWRRLPLQALYLSDQKKTISSIARYLDVDYSTVRNWFRRYRKAGLDEFIKWVNRAILPPKKKP